MDNNISNLYQSIKIEDDGYSIKPTKVKTASALETLKTIERVMRESIKPQDESDKQTDHRDVLIKLASKIKTDYHNKVASSSWIVRLFDKILHKEEKVDQLYNEIQLLKEVDPLDKGITYDLKANLLWLENESKTDSDIYKNLVMFRDAKELGYQGKDIEGAKKHLNEAKEVVKKLSGNKHIWMTEKITKLAKQNDGAVDSILKMKKELENNPDTVTGTLMVELRNMIAVYQTQSRGQIEALFKLMTYMGLEPLNLNVDSFGKPPIKTSLIIFAAANRNYSALEFLFKQGGTFSLNDDPYSFLSSKRRSQESTLKTLQISLQYGQPPQSNKVNEYFLHQVTQFDGSDSGLKLIKLLLNQEGADIKTKDTSGKTALDIAFDGLKNSKINAAANFKLIELLLRNGALNGLSNRYIEQLKENVDNSGMGGGQLKFIKLITKYSHSTAVVSMPDKSSEV